MKKTYTLITWASSGIGKEFAYFYAEKKHNLLLVARREELLQEIKADLENTHKIEVVYLITDVSTREGIHTITKWIDKQQANINFLINNAGIALPGDMGTLTEEGIIQIMNINMQAIVLLCNAIIPQMKKAKNGKILNIASLAAFFPGIHHSLYFATKAFVLNFSNALHYEGKPYNIQVSAVCPGFTKTDILKSFSNTGKLATPREVVEYANYLIQHNKPFWVHKFANKYKAFLGRYLPLSRTAKMVSKE